MMIRAVPLDDLGQVISLHVLLEEVCKGVNTHTALVLLPSLLKQALHLLIGHVSPKSLHRQHFVLQGY